VLVSPAGIISVDNDKAGIITGAANVTYERISDYRFSLDTLEKIRKNRLQIPFKKDLSLLVGSSVIDLDIDIKSGYAIVDSYAGIATPLGELIYRKANGDAAPEALENLIFAKFSSVIPGEEQVTLYRGNPQGVNAPFITGQAEELVCTYYLYTTFENIPEDVFKNVTTAGMAVYDGGALTKINDHLNDTAASLFTIDEGDVSYTPADGKLRWSQMRLTFRDTNGSGYNEVFGSSGPTEFSPIVNEYVYVVIDRDGTAVEDNYVKHSIDPWGTHPGREYDIFIFGKIISTGSMLILQRAKYGRLWSDTRKIYSNINITKYGSLFFSGALAKLTWGNIELSFNNPAGTNVRNTISADAVGITLAQDEYAYILLQRDSLTVKDNTIKKSTDPWSTESMAPGGAGRDLDVIILGQCKGSAVPYKFVQTIGGGDGSGAGGEWVAEENAPSVIVGTNQIEISDADNIRLNIYNVGRFLRIQTQTGLGAGNYYYCQVFTAVRAANIVTLIVENVRDKDGNVITMPSGGTILTFEYSSMQMKYMGVSGDVNPLNRSLLDHVKDFSIHTTYKYILKTQDVSSQVGAGGTNLVFNTDDEGNDESFSVYVNGLLLSPSEFEVLSISSFRVNINLIPTDLVGTTYVLHGQEQDYVFNEDLTPQIPSSVFVTESNFVPSSIQVFKNGAKMPAATAPNGYSVTGLNEITLQTSLASGDSLVVHYDKTGATNVVIFNEVLSAQSPGYTFNTEHSFFPESVIVYRNGQLLHRNSNPNGYSVSGSRTISFNTNVETWEDIVVAYNRQWSQVGAMIDLSDVSIENPRNNDRLIYSSSAGKWLNTKEDEHLILKVKTITAGSYADFSSVPKSGIITAVWIKCLTSPDMVVQLTKTNDVGVVTPLSYQQAIITTEWTVLLLAENTVSIDDVVSIDVPVYTTGSNLLVQVDITYVE